MGDVAGQHMHQHGDLAGVGARVAAHSAHLRVVHRSQAFIAHKVDEATHEGMSEIQHFGGQVVLADHRIKGRLQNLRVGVADVVEFGTRPQPDPEPVRIQFLYAAAEPAERCSDEGPDLFGRADGLLGDGEGALDFVESHGGVAIEGL